MFADLAHDFAPAHNMDMLSVMYRKTKTTRGMQPASFFPDYIHSNFYPHIYTAAVCLYKLLK